MEQVFFYYPSYAAKLIPDDAENSLAAKTKALGVKGGHNTLLDQASIAEMRHVPFGEYIFRKWEGVSRVGGY